MWTVTALCVRLRTIEIVPAWDAESCTLGPPRRVSFTIFSPQLQWRRRGRTCAAERGVHVLLLVLQALHPLPAKHNYAKAVATEHKLVGECHALTGVDVQHMGEKPSPFPAPGQTSPGISEVILSLPSAYIFE